jgi:hypothetical protein
MGSAGEHEIPGKIRKKKHLDIKIPVARIKDRTIAPASVTASPMIAKFACGRQGQMSQEIAFCLWKEIRAGGTFETAHQVNCSHWRKS